LKHIDALLLDLRAFRGPPDRVDAYDAGRVDLYPVRQKR
jgi:hypothetical protein